MSAQLPGLDDLLAEKAGCSGVLAVLDAADRLHERLADAEHLASFAPPVSFYGACPCGSVLEIRGDLDDEDRDAVLDWHSEHDGCEDDA